MVYFSAESRKYTDFFISENKASEANYFNCQDSVVKGTEKAVIERTHNTHHLRAAAGNKLVYAGSQEQFPSTGRSAQMETC